MNLIMMSLESMMVLMLIATNTEKIYVAEATMRAFVYTIEHLPNLRKFYFAYFLDVQGSVKEVLEAYKILTELNPRLNRNVTFHPI